MTNHFTLKATTVLAITVVTALLGTGCGRTGNTSEAEAPVWDPCTAFPESAMQSLGQDYKALQGAQMPGMRCSWVDSQTGYSLDVQYRTKDQYGDWKSEAEDPAEVKIGPYNGHTYHTKGSNHQFECALQLKTKNSDVVFLVTNQLYKQEDPCVYATRVATTLKTYLPPA